MITVIKSPYIQMKNKKINTYRPETHVINSIGLLYTYGDLARGCPEPMENSNL